MDLNKGDIDSQDKTSTRDMHEKSQQNSGDKEKRTYTSTWEEKNSKSEKGKSENTEINANNNSSKTGLKLSDQTSARKHSPKTKSPREIYLEQKKENEQNEKLWFVWGDGKKKVNSANKNSGLSKMENKNGNDIGYQNAKGSAEAKEDRSVTRSGQKSPKQKSRHDLAMEKKKEENKKEKQWYIWDENKSKSPTSKRNLKNKLDDEYLPQRNGGLSPRMNSRNKEKFDKHWSVWNLHKEKTRLNRKSDVVRSEPAGIKYQENNGTPRKQKRWEDEKGHWSVWRNGKPGNTNNEIEGTDYIQHPMEKPYVRAPEQYIKPQGNMDTTTSYKKDYTEKYGVPSKPIKLEGMRQVQGKFEGEPTYKSDYRPWELSRTQPFVSQDAWVPPNARFEGQSTMQHDYRKYNQAPRQALRPMEAARMSDLPFDASTGYRDSYIKHPIPPRYYKEQEQYKSPTAKFEDTTTFKRDYRGYPGQRMESFRPDNRAFQSGQPLDDVTTNRNDYRKWPLEKPFVHQPDQYHRPEGEMETTTTHKTTYREHPLQHRAQIRPSSARKLADAKFEGVTNYSQDYRKWDGANRPRPMAREEYQPNTAPFEGMSTQKSHYIPHDIQPHRNYKPDTGAFLSNAEFDGTTMYRVDYTPKKINVCPAGLLDGPTASYSFVNVDSRGHKQYTPVIETVSQIPQAAMG